MKPQTADKTAFQRYQIHKPRLKPHLNVSETATHNTMHTPLLMVIYSFDFYRSNNQPITMKCPLLQLPVELRQHLFTFLSPPDLLNVARCSKVMCACVTPLLWRHVQVPCHVLEQRSLPGNTTNLKHTNSECPPVVVIVVVVLVVGLFDHFILPFKIIHYPPKKTHNHRPDRRPTGRKTKSNPYMSRACDGSLLSP